MSSFEAEKSGKALVSDSAIEFGNKLPEDIVLLPSSPLAAEAIKTSEPAGLENALWSYKEKVHGPLGITLCICGVALSLTSCSIWRRRSVLLTGNLPLVAISGCYAVICLAYLPLLVTMYCVKPYSAPKEQRNSYVNMLITSISSQLQLTAHAIVLWLGVLMEFQRVVCVSSRVPLRQNRLVSERITQLGIIAVALVVIATSAPYYVVSELAPRRCQSGNIKMNLTIRTCHNLTDSSSPRSNDVGSSPSFTHRITADAGVNASANEVSRLCRTSRPVDCAYYTVRFRPSVRTLALWTHVALHKILPCFLMVVLSAILCHSLGRLAGRRRCLLRQSFSLASHDELDLRSSVDIRNFQDRKRAFDVPGSRSESAHGRGFGYKASHKNSVSSGSVQNRFHQVNQNVTRILLMVVVSMIISQLPPAIVLICSARDYKKLGELFDVLSLLDATASFVLYCRMSATFRREFVYQLDLIITALWRCCATLQSARFQHNVT